MAKEPKKMGRPQKEIEQSKFEGLCRLQCTLPEIAGVLEVSEDTVERWCKRTYDRTFAEVFRQKRQGGFVSLRRNQFKMSETNPTMAIWLGKQYLNQTDSTDINIGNKDGKPFETEIRVIKPKVNDDDSA